MGAGLAATRRWRRRRQWAALPVSLVPWGASGCPSCVAPVVQVWHRRSVRWLDSERAGAEVLPGCVPYWAVAGVEVAGELHADAHIEGESSGGVEGSSSLQAESRSFTRRVMGHVLFARGPLPRSAVPELHTPWFIIGWF